MTDKVKCVKAFEVGTKYEISDFQTMTFPDHVRWSSQFLNSSSFFLFEYFFMLSLPEYLVASYLLKLMLIKEMILQTSINGIDPRW